MGRLDDRRTSGPRRDHTQHGAHPRCHPTTVKGLIRDGVLETFTIGCRRLVLYESLQRLVDERRKQPGDPRRNTAVPKAGERRPRKAEATAP
jgi:hypothetical protein